jgi:hypothetical protein
MKERSHKSRLCLRDGKGRDLPTAITATKNAKPSSGAKRCGGRPVDGIHPVRAAVATCGIGTGAPALPGSAISLVDRASQDYLLQAGLERLPTSSNLSARSSLHPK